MNVDSAVPLGSMYASPSLFESSWLRVSLIDHELEDGRWLRIQSYPAASCTASNETISINPQTVWNYFGVWSVGGQLVLRVNIAILPKYLECPVCASPPVASGSILGLAIARDFYADSLICSNLSYWERVIHGALREAAFSSVLVEGDSFWIKVEEGGQWIPVVVEKLPVETFFDVTQCRIGQPKIARFPPSPAERQAVDLHRPETASISSALQEDLSSERRLFVYGLRGSSRTAIPILYTSCLDNGIPLARLPVDQLELVRGAACEAAWILETSGGEKSSFECLRRLCSWEFRKPCFVFVVGEEEVSESLLGRLVSRIWTIRPPSESERRRLLSSLSPPEVEVHEAVHASLGLHENGLEGAISLSVLDDVPLSESLKIIRQRGQSRFSRAAEIPKVYWSDIAGLEEAKGLMLEFMQSSLHPEKGRLGRRCGVLMYGPPGTGKTLMAKAVATEFNFSFISIKGPELLDIYVGESEAHIREIFAQARDLQPCILFFDELDSLAVARGRDGDAGGVTDRLVAQLLTELDDLLWNPRSQSVFIIGATNRPDLLDPALMRPGRFDIRIYLGLPESRAEQVAILRAASRPYLVDVDIDFDSFAELLSMHLSPADLASIVQTAMKLRIAAVIKESIAAGNVPLHDQTVPIGLDDLMRAAAMIRPSISDAQLQMYRSSAL